MKFGPVPVAEAEGAILAHSLQLDGKRLKKGRMLTPSDVKAIAGSGVGKVIAARLEDGDVPENEAAKILAAALTGDGLRTESPFTGRVNLHANHDGLFDVHRASVDAFNAVDPAITLATLPEGELVETGRMVATVKIIPFAAPGKAVEECRQLAEDAFMLSVKPATAMRVALIQTQLPTVKASVLDKTRRNLTKRLAPSESEIADERRVAHDAESIRRALAAIDEKQGFDEERDLIVIFGASAITDRADVIPQALEAAGGTVRHLGMPVDPGNLLMIGRFGGRDVIGAPGCARSTTENGFDWVLQRVIHGAYAGSDYITRLGVGGLLMEIHDGPRPREG